MRISGFTRIVACLLILVCLPVFSSEAKVRRNRSAPYNPMIDPANFTNVIDNPYFPLHPGTVFSYLSETADGTETDEVTVTHTKKQILGVTTVVVHDLVFLNGSLTEDTFDWYAQDKDGNVWYFGEDAKQFDEHGVLIGTEGSWEAGKDGAEPGIVMEANPKIGDTYRQEFLAGVAEDMAKVVGLHKSVSVPYGNFNDCIETVDWTPLEPGVREHKFYCAGVGLVLEVAPNGGRVRNELINVFP